GGSLTKIGTGTLTLDNPNAAYIGATTVAAGMLALLNGADMSNTRLMTGNSGATFDISGNQTIKDLSGVAGSMIQLGANSLTGGTVNSTSFPGSIDGSAGLTKIGTGTLTLSGANTYTGGTTVAGGTLRLANNQALGTGALTTTGSVVDYANGVSIANA